MARLLVLLGWAREGATCHIMWHMACDTAVHGWVPQMDQE
jgi:hypothetical protein